MLQSNSKWNALQKISFRFILIYFSLHISIFYISFIPYTSSLITWLTGKIQSLPVWVADKFLGIEITIFPSGSGDTTYNYVEVLVFFVLAIIGCIIWSIIDRKRNSYNRLLRLFRIYVSYYVAAFMLSYGLSKIFYLQFSEPSFIELFRTYAESSPMGIAWTFMGASKAYTMFSGFAEVIGGLLLFHRRTRTFGALVVFAVMLNVFMMNMSYDIPVKLFSFHLMIKALFIALLDYKRILNLIVFKKAKNFVNEITPVFENKKWGIAATVLKFAFIGYAFYTYTSSNYEYWEQRYKQPAPHLYGVYDTENFIINSDTIAPLLTDNTRWKKLIIDKGYFSKYMIIRGMNDRPSWYEYELDSVQKTLKMTSVRDSLDILDLTYTRNDSLMAFKGLWKNDTIEINLKKYDLTKIRLTNRGFNWINEYPYNR
ncbi:MAG: hypothetical protein ED556_04805 [Winogradskyella sp.]|uniref:DoxX family protein n=1 Tax=Winogradskyella sp. TaxID=1883156 RepID=UPI000F3E608F|nr:hypothetical protein [Winogradskyella sp.]RNC86743.1 MAG: hypothetical protein ED556_04805 [Winogradskyella sp.]